jgi:hypothetical protein
MTTMISLILAIMLSIGGSPAVGPGAAGIQGPIDNSCAINHFFEDYSQKTASRVDSKKTPGTPLINQPKTQIMLSFQLCLKEKLYLRGYMDSMNLYQGFNMNPVNFTDPMGEHTFKTINLFGIEIEVAEPDLDEIHGGHYAMRFSYEYKGKIHNVIIDQHTGEEWAFQAKLGNPILKPLWEAFYGVSTSEIKDSAFKLWFKSFAHHSPEIVMSALGSITYMAEANAAKNAAKLEKSQNLSKITDHHPIPQYMGGRKNQKLVGLIDDVHDGYHEFLDNWKLPKGMEPRSPAPKSFGGPARPWGRENAYLRTFAAESRANRKFIVDNLRKAYKEYGIYNEVAEDFEREAKIFIEGVK